MESNLNLSKTNSSDYVLLAEEVSEVKLQYQSIPKLIQRTAVLTGRVGVGKTTLNGCFCRELNQQEIGLRSKTKFVSATMLHIEQEGDSYVFSIYDSKGFTGDIFTDIWILFDLVKELSGDVPKIHVVYFCLSSIRKNAADESIVRMFHRYGGEQLLSRVKLIVTNTPSLAVEKELREEIMEDGEKLFKRKLAFGEDILFSNLEDVRYKETLASQKEVTAVWTSTTNRLHENLISTKQYVRMNDYDIFWRWKCILDVYKNRILFALLVVIVCVLVLDLIAFKMTYDTLVNLNDECQKELSKTAIGAPTGGSKTVVYIIDAVRNNTQGFKKALSGFLFFKKNK
jgi:hypothetical protein